MTPMRAVRVRRTAEAAGLRSAGPTGTGPVPLTQARVARRARAPRAGRFAALAFLPSSPTRKS
jgi:hypothetical protein